uniref:Homeobox domain-containing protein n=1 Tax=Macrostomum lignano TaxID=282301 RepID=A0A1I8I4T3_9PLAT
ARTMQRVPSTWPSRQQAASKRRLCQGHQRQQQSESMRHVDAAHSQPLLPPAQHRKGRTPGSLPLLSAQCYLDAVNLPYDSMKLSFRQMPTSAAAAGCAAFSTDSRRSRQLLPSSEYERQKAEFHELLCDPAQSRAGMMVDLLSGQQLSIRRNQRSGIAPSRSTNDLASAAAVAAAAAAAATGADASTARPTSRERRRERRLLFGQQGEAGGAQQLQPRQQRRNPRQESLPLQPPGVALGELLEIRTAQSLVLQRREPTTVTQGRPAGHGLPPSRHDAAAADGLHQDSAGSFCCSGIASSRRPNGSPYSSGYYGNRRSAQANSGNSQAAANCAEKYRFSDPSVGAAVTFCQRLSEMTSLVAETVRFERGRTGKTKRK